MGQQRRPPARPQTRAILTPQVLATFATALATGVFGKFNLRGKRAIVWNAALPFGLTTGSPDCNLRMPAEYELRRASRGARTVRGGAHSWRLTGFEPDPIRSFASRDPLRVAVLYQPGMDSAAKPQGHHGSRRRIGQCLLQFERRPHRIEMHQ
jgi:hypothetical protein